MSIVTVDQENRASEYTENLVKYLIIMIYVIGTVFQSMAWVRIFNFINQQCSIVLGNHI